MFELNKIISLNQWPQDQIIILLWFYYLFLLPLIQGSPDGLRQQIKCVKRSLLSLLSHNSHTIVTFNVTFNFTIHIYLTTNAFGKLNFRWIDFKSEFGLRNPAGSPSLEFLGKLKPVTLHHYSSLVTHKLSEILEFRSLKLDDEKNFWGRVRDGSTEIQWKIVFLIFIYLYNIFQTSLHASKTIHF